MANIKSAMKRAKVSEARTKRNAAYKSRMRTAIRRYERALHTGDLVEAKDLLLQASRIIDKTQSKGVIHKNMADRKKSRLAKALNRAS